MSHVMVRRTFFWINMNMRTLILRLGLRSSPSKKHHLSIYEHSHFTEN